MSISRLSSWFFIAFWLLLTGPAIAQNSTPPPPALSQQQMDAMVEAVSQAVIRKMQSEGSLKPAATAPAPDNAQTADSQDTRLFRRMGEILLTMPALLRQIGQIPVYLDAAHNEGRGLGHYLALLILGIVIVLSAEYVLRKLLAPLRRKLADRIAPSPSGFGALIILALLEAPPLLAFWVASNAIKASNFMGNTPQVRFSILVLWSLLIWRLVMVAFRITLRPDLPKARLPDLNDADAHTIYRFLSMGVIIIIACRAFGLSLQATNAPADIIACAQILTATIMAAILSRLCFKLRAPVGRWFSGISRSETGIKAMLAANWHIYAVTLLVLLGCADIYAAVAGDITVPRAIILSFGILLGLLLAESLMYRLYRLIDPEEQGNQPLMQAQAARALTRCVRFALLLLVFGLLAQIWAVEVTGMMAKDELAPFARSFIGACITIFGAFCLWELVNYLTGRYLQGSGRRILPPGLGEEDDVSVTVASRLTTIMPLMRIAIALTIGIVALLMALSQLGINVTPLIAGASIFGLAISFGSQTLVKDIVSGVFYLVDDAFRVGEYIDCGKAKGTVQGFTLRSLQLRHQNGPVHTVPYGQLGQITNYSRDWATIKFTLRFNHETDVEKLRKAVKKIGQEMLEDPELKDEFLTPLKMQGIFDIVDNALVVRFKFTVRPQKPTFIQREALKRLVSQLPALGIHFATTAVSIRSFDDTLPPQAARNAAAAYPATLPPPQTPPE